MKYLSIMLLCLFMGFHTNAAEEEKAKASVVTASKPAEAAKKASVVTASKPTEAAKKASVVTASKPAKAAKKASVVTASKPAEAAKKASVVTASKPAEAAKKASVVTASKPAKAAKKASVVTASKPAEAAKKASVVTVSNPTAIAIDTTPQGKEEKKHVVKHHSKRHLNKAFFSIYLINEFMPLKNFEYEHFGPSLGYGGSLFHKSSFELNAKILFPSPGPVFSVKYEQDFTRSYRWIPGFDTSLLFGIGEPTRGGNRYFPALSVGLEGGVFVKTFITKCHALLARTGLNTALPVNNFNFYDLDPKFYISIGLKKYFK